jgi:hypothetical protein
MAAKLTRLTHSIDTTRGRKLYHLQFSHQAVSPETFGYTLECLHVLFPTRAKYSSPCYHPTPVGSVNHEVSCRAFFSIVHSVPLSQDRMLSLAFDTELACHSAGTPPPTVALGYSSRAVVLGQVCSMFHAHLLSSFSSGAGIDRMSKEHSLIPLTLVIPVTLWALRKVGKHYRVAGVDLPQLLVPIPSAACCCRRAPLAPNRCRHIPSILVVLIWEGGRGGAWF